jgi:acyl carrier protein
LRIYLQQRLPAHMVPSAFVMVDSLPYTPNRKIDKKALAALRPPPASSGSGIPAAGGLSHMISDLFQEALGLDNVGIHENFFDLGANSMIVAEVVVKLRDALHREIPLTDFFKYPTITALAAHLDRGSEETPLLAGSLDRGQARQQVLLRRSNIARVREKQPDRP